MKHRYYVTFEGPGGAPDLLFRTPDSGGPPVEAYDPETSTWQERVSLIDYFLGDATGHMEVDEQHAESAALSLRPE